MTFDNTCKCGKKYIWETNFIGGLHYDCPQCKFRNWHTIFGIGRPT